MRAAGKRDPGGLAAEGMLRRYSRRREGHGSSRPATRRFASPLNPARPLRPHRTIDRSSKARAEAGVAVAVQPNSDMRLVSRVCDASVAPGTDRTARPEPAAQIDAPSNGRFGVCARGLPLQERPELASVAQKRRQCRHFYLPTSSRATSHAYQQTNPLFTCKNAFSPTQRR
jgi:hypothetical protein